MATFLCFLSCRKDFFNGKNHDATIAERFLAHSPQTNKIVLSVIEEVKTRNNKSGFVSEFAAKNGFPVWDKPIVTYSTNKSTTVNELARSNSDEPVIDTFAYIPIVPENSDRVNGFILAKISNGVELLYSLAQDYKAFSFADDGNLNDATKFVITNLLLNKEVFGVSDYTITDYQLFTGDPEHDKASTLSIEGRLDAGQCATISWGTWHCGTPNDVACQNGCDHCGGLCYPIASSVEICVAPNTVNWPPGGIGVNPGGGGGDGGSGGGEIPHYYPCISKPTPSRTDDPPCPSPGPGSGWETDTLNPDNPCDVVDSLLKTAKFKNHLKMLRDSTVLNHETGVSFTNPLDPTRDSFQTYTGTTDSLAVNIELTQPTDGIAHNHNNSPNRLHNFSSEDIYKVAYYWSLGQIKSFQTFTYTVVTDSTSYILMVTNPAQFMSFAQTWFDSEKHLRAFKVHLYDNHHYADPGNSILQDETNFLTALQATPINGGGFKLFKGNSDMSIFTPIKLNSSGQITPDPCN